MEIDPISDLNDRLKPMTQFKLYLFGPPRLEGDGKTIDISLRKAQALLVYLAVTRQPHSRDTLATLLWPDSDQRSARANLRRALHQVNQYLGEALAATLETIAFHPQAELWLDIEIYRQHLAACLPPSDSAAELSSECLSRLTEAATLYAADFLAGFTLPDCLDFDEWQFFQAEELRQLLIQLLAVLVPAYQTQAKFKQAIAYARRWLSLEPLHEPAQRQLIQLYAQAGHRTAALRQYQTYVRLLDEELGLPPAEETTTLYEAIKAKHLLSPFIKQTGEQSAPETMLSKDNGPQESSTSASPLPPQPKTRFVQSGDVHIAYQVFGEGPIDVVFINGFVSHLEHMWEQPDLARFMHQLASFSRLIMFDKRGVGLSDRVGYPPSLEHTMDDVLAVMEAVGSKQAVLFGVSQGGPNSALMAATYPEHVLGLILYGSLAKWLRTLDYPWGLTREQFDKAVGRYMTHWGGPVRLEYFAPSRAGDEGFKQWWARLLRLASSPGGIREVLEVSRDFDVRHILPTIRVPTLVLHRSGDKIIPLEAGRYMASLIPSATFVELPGQDHFWWIGDTETVLEEIQHFLEGLKQSAPPDRILATILMAEVSDTAAKGQTRLADDFQLEAKTEITRFRGLESEQINFDILATFDSPSRALQCAIAINALAQTHQVDIRTGLHTGECEFTGGVLGGITLQIAAEVMAKAKPGETLVSTTVKDLVVGSGFDFEECGRHRLKGLSGKSPLFALKRSTT